MTNLAILWTGILPAGGYSYSKHDYEIFCFFSLTLFHMEAHCFALLEIIIKFVNE